MMSRISDTYLLLIGAAFALLWIGCGEKPEPADDILVERSNSPYVQSILHEGAEGKTGIVIKYLLPQSLASAEAGDAKARLDSLVNLYARSMSFLVTVKCTGGNALKPFDSTSIPAAYLSDDLKRCFWIETGDTVYAPDIVQLEHHDGNQRRYLVLFSVDPRQEFAVADNLTFAFANPEGSSGIERVHFAAADILRSSTNLAQLTR